MPKSKARAGLSRNFRRRIDTAITASRVQREVAANPQLQPGARNAYQCNACAGHAVTEHADAGTTPMFLMSCKVTEGCPGRMVSGMYRPVPVELGEPAWQWYTPDAAEIRTLSRGEREHVNLGGLLLRPITRPITTESETSHAG